MAEGGPRDQNSGSQAPVKEEGVEPRPGHSGRPASIWLGHSGIVDGRVATWEMEGMRADAVVRRKLDGSRPVGSAKRLSFCEPAASKRVWGFELEADCSVAQVGNIVHEDTHHAPAEV